MFKKIITTAASAAVVAGVLLAAPANATGVTLAGGGSSFANGMMTACAAAYNATSGNIVSYTKSDSGTGRTGFRTGSFQYAASDGTYASTDSFINSATGQPYANGSTYVTVPLLGGPVVFAYSAVGVNDGLKLTPQIVSDIFKGNITRWDDAALKTLNPKVKLPKKAIKVALRADGSGTTANLTNYLSQTVGSTVWTASSKNLKTASKDGKFAPINTEFSNSQDLAAYVEDNANAFGYFDLSDATTADVGISALQNAAGAFVIPTASSAAKFIGAQSPSIDTSDRLNGTLVIDFTKVVPGAYQLSIVTYGIAPRFAGTGKSTNNTALAVQDFFNYVVKTCVPAKAGTLGYVALGGALKTSALNQIKKIG
jgi:phosphate transport system substrate-binding protein